MNMKVALQEILFIMKKESKRVNPAGLLPAVAALSAEAADPVPAGYGRAWTYPEQPIRNNIHSTRDMPISSPLQHWLNSNSARYSGFRSVSCQK